MDVKLRELYSNTPLDGAKKIAFQDLQSTSIAFWQWAGPILPKSEAHTVPLAMLALVANVHDLLSGGETEATPESVSQEFLDIVSAVRDAIPADRRAYIDLTASGSPYTMSAMHKWRGAIQGCLAHV